MKRTGIAALWACLAGATTMSAGTAQDTAFHFAHRISPVLAKAGCSAAECHGGGNGRGGFKLSLFAAEPLADYATITTELGGRRVDLSRPENSLFLKKPSRRLKHKGGRIFEQDDRNYRALLDWIAAGAPYTRGDPPRLTGIRIEAASSESVKVVASFKTNGGTSREDVTHLAMLESTNDSVVRIDESGRFRMEEPGEAWILARYGKFSARHPVRKPFAESPGPVAGAHPLDEAWLERLAQLGLQPAPPAGDEVLLRRLFIDLTGRPPTPFDLDKALSLPGETRLAATAEKLMDTTAFEDVFARHLGSWFEVPPKSGDGRNDGPRNDALRAWFRETMRAGKSLADISRELLIDRQRQAAWKHFSDPRDRAEYVGRTMLGIQIGCARCHDHPLDRWTNAEHLSFAAYFSDPRPSASGAMMPGKLFRPGTNHPVTPALLPLGTGKAPASLKPEEQLAWFILERGGDQFSRNFANRIFETLIGKPLVSEANDHRLSNPALHEPLLDLLTRRFAQDGHDLRAAVRFLVTSRLYGLTSEPGEEGSITGDPAAQYLARREALPLTPHQFKAAVEQVLGVAIDREEPPDSPLARQLYVMNSGLIQSGLAAPGNQVDAISDFENEAERQLVELYRLILARAPRSEEIARLRPELEGADDPRKAGRDLALALMASREFGSKR